MVTARAKVKLADGSVMETARAEVKLAAGNLYRAMASFRALGETVSPEDTEAVEDTEKAEDSASDKSLSDADFSCPEWIWEVERRSGSVRARCQETPLQRLTSAWKGWYVETTKEMFNEWVEHLDQHKTIGCPTEVNLSNHSFSWLFGALQLCFGLWSGWVGQVLVGWVVVRPVLVGRARVRLVMGSGSVLVTVSVRRVLVGWFQVGPVLG